MDDNIPYEKRILILENRIHEAILNAADTQKASIQETAYVLCNISNIFNRKCLYETIKRQEARRKKNAKETVSTERQKNLQG